MRITYEVQYYVFDASGKFVESWYDRKEAKGQAKRIGGKCQKVLVEVVLKSR